MHFSFHKAKARHLRLGQKGEDIAANILQERGMELLCRNYHGPHGELDLVLRENGVLCIAEVKTRHRQTFGSPADAVDQKKRKAILHTTRRYLKAIHAPKLPCRFDIVEVIFDHNHLSDVRHWPNAFQAAPNHGSARF